VVLVPSLCWWPFASPSEVLRPWPRSRSGLLSPNRNLVLLLIRRPSFAAVGALRASPSSWRVALGRPSTPALDLEALAAAPRRRPPAGPARVPRLSAARLSFAPAAAPLPVLVSPCASSSARPSPTAAGRLPPPGPPSRAPPARAVLRFAGRPLLVSPPGRLPLPRRRRCSRAETSARCSQPGRV